MENSTLIVVSLSRTKFVEIAQTKFVSLLFWNSITWNINNMHLNVTFKEERKRELKV